MSLLQSLHDMLAGKNLLLGIKHIFVTDLMLNVISLFQL